MANAHLSAAFAACLLATLAGAQAQTGDTTARPVTTALPKVEVTDGAEGQATGSGQHTAREESVSKLVQSPRETPQSISVITRQQLGDRNVTKVEDAVKLSTGGTDSTLSSHRYQRTSSRHRPPATKLLNAQLQFDDLRDQRADRFPGLVQLGAGLR